MSNVLAFACCFVVAFDLSFTGFGDGVLHYSKVVSIDQRRPGSQAPQP